MAQSKKNKVGAPKDWTDEKIQDLLVKFEKYIDETKVPIIAEFAVQNNTYRQRLYEFKQFADAIKKCTSKKEAALERGALENKLNPTMCIYSLKQLGWKDKQEFEHSGKDGKPIETTNKFYDKLAKMPTTELIKVLKAL